MFLCCKNEFISVWFYRSQQFIRISLFHPRVRWFVIMIIGFDEHWTYKAAFHISEYKMVCHLNSALTLTISWQVFNICRWSPKKWYWIIFPEFFSDCSIIRFVAMSSRKQLNKYFPHNKKTITVFDDPNNFINLWLDLVILFCFMS